MGMFLCIYISNKLLIFGDCWRRPVVQCIFHVIFEKIQNFRWEVSPHLYSHAVVRDSISPTAGFAADKSKLVRFEKQIIRDLEPKEFEKM